MNYMNNDLENYNESEDNCWGKGKIYLNLIIFIFRHEQSFSK